MRAKNKIFHLECFRCIACNKQLVPGDEFALRPEGLFCKEDHNHSVNDNQEENNNNTNATEDGLEEVEDMDEEERSQDDIGDEKDLLLLEDHPSLSLAHDRFADSGELKFLLVILYVCALSSLPKIGTATRHPPSLYIRCQMLWKKTQNAY